MAYENFLKFEYRNTKYETMINDQNSNDRNNVCMNDTRLMKFVIPGLTRNPGFLWIPAFAGMTRSAVINDAVQI